MVAKDTAEKVEGDKLPNVVAKDTAEKVEGDKLPNVVAKDTAEKVEGDKLPNVVAKDTAEKVEGDKLPNVVAKDTAEKVEGDKLPNVVAKDTAEKVEGDKLPNVVAKDTAEKVEGDTTKMVAKDTAEKVEGDTTKMVVKKNININKSQQYINTTDENTKFINDEVVNLLLPNDEVVLGALTDKEYIELLNYSEYIRLFWNNFYRNQQIPSEILVQKFLENYDLKFHNKIAGAISLYPNLSWCGLKQDAFRAVAKNDINSLRAIIDNTNSILTSRDSDGDTLLIKSVKLDNYNLTKFLLFRKIDVLAYNFNNETANIIAHNNQYDNIIKLLDD